MYECMLCHSMGLGTAWTGWRLLVEERIAKISKLRNPYLESLDQFLGFDNFLGSLHSATLSHVSLLFTVPFFEVMLYHLCVRRDDTRLGSTLIWDPSSWKFSLFHIHFFNNSLHYIVITSYHWCHSTSSFSTTNKEISVKFLAS